MIKKILWGSLLALALAFSLPMAAFAAGDGSGTGSSEPLTVSSASISDGATIDPTASITLSFSKNVVNSSVADANKAKIALTDSAGKSVAITVTMADDQVNPDQKRNIVVTAAEALPAGNYTLTAQAGIAAKSGDTLASDYVLKFTVAGDTNSSTASANANASANSNANANANSNASGTSTTSTNNSGSMTTVIVVIVVVVVVIAIIGVVVAKRKKQ